jgi:RNA polymerase sigma factor (sigma-70 family)
MQDEDHGSNGSGNCAAPDEACGTASLVTRVRRGERDSEDELVRLLAPGLKRAASRYCDNPADREDLIGEMWEVALPRLRQGALRDGELASAYLAGVLRRLAANTRRKSQRRRVLITAEVPDGAAITTETPECLASRYQQLLVICAAIAALPAPRDRQVLRALLLEQQPECRVAGRFGLTPSQFSKVASRARSRLRRALSHEHARQANCPADRSGGDMD